MRFAPPFEVACAMAHASERWFATPTMSPVFPVKSDISGSSCRLAAAVRRPGPCPAALAVVVGLAAVIAEAHRTEVILAAAAGWTPPAAAELVLGAAGVALSAAAIAPIVAGIEW